MRRLGIVLLLAFGLVAGVATTPSVLESPSVAAAHPEPGDIDGDGVGDKVDNCPETRNGDQRNTDSDTPNGDSFGDRCDTDADADGVENSLPYLDRGQDNCPVVANPDQTPAAQNPKYGAACYVDTDGDAVPDPLDNCPDLANADQADYDYDRTGDLCDPDNDEDGEFDAVDNCPFVYNYDQGDVDGDGRGTACDDFEVAPSGGGGGGPGGGRDDTAPALQLTLARTQRLRELGRSLPVEVRCDEGCTVRASLTVKRATARKLGIRSRTLASGSARLGDAGTTYVFMRFKRGTVRRLERARAVRAQLSVTGADSAGNGRSEDRPVRLRR
jgi:Thrombospondin type 3 repeat